MRDRFLLLLGRWFLDILLGRYCLHLIYELTYLLCGKQSFILASLNIVLQLLKEIFALLNFLKARLDGFFSSFRPCWLFVTKSHTIGFHGKCSIHGCLWILHLKSPLEGILLFGVCYLLLDFEAASYLGFYVIKSMPILFADDLLRMSLSLHSA